MFGRSWLCSGDVVWCVDWFELGIGNLCYVGDYYLVGYSVGGC